MPDSTLDDPQQTIADLQRANAELQRQLAERTAELNEAQQQLNERTAERNEGEAQKAAISEVLGVINSSPGDLGPVFEAILEKAHSLCGAAFGALWTYDGDHFDAVALRRVPAGLAEFLSRRPFPTPAPGSAHDRLLRGERVVQIDDVAAQPSIGPARRALVEDGGARTLIAVPLRKDDHLLGAITAYRQEVRPFTERQIDLLQNFAAQAVIAMENARLINETRDALEQQTATAEVLQVINSSPGDLTPVFDAVLEKATRLCDAVFGNLWTYDGEVARFAAARGASPEFRAELVQAGPQKPEPGNALMRLVQGEPLVHIADITAEGPYQSVVRRRFAEGTGARTALWVPLRKDGAFLGFFSIYRTEVRAFTEKQIALLQNFAAQAVIAMENARLITETREALEQQTATAEVLQVINSSPGDLAPVFDAILEKAHSLCGAVYGSLNIYNDDQLRAVAVRGLSEGFADRLRSGVRPSAAHPVQALHRGVPFVQVPDVAEIDDPVTRAAFEIGGLRTVLFVPLRKDERLLGNIVAARPEVRLFSEKQIALLQNFAAQAVIAMENARLITETREALEQQTATAEVLQIINASPGDLAPVFDAILEKAHTLCGASFGALGIREGEFFRAVALRGPPAALTEVGRRAFRSLPDEPVGQLLRGEPFIQVPDMAELAPRAESSLGRALVELAGVRTQLLVALRKDDAVLGFISAYRQEVRPFSDKEITLLQNFAAQAVIAIENARLLGELRQRTEEVGELNRDLEARVVAQVDELGRVGRLKRFLAPQLAELIVSQGDEKILESHRREIVVVFCDLRGYTAFTETAEPEEVLDFLRQYHGALGPLVSQFEGTLDQFSGDGIMVFFNDPVPCPDPAERAVKMAVAMREAAGTLIAAWRRRGRMLGFGAGIAQGYATLGQIGFADRSGYTAIGTVCNLAARLCAEAKDGQILIAQRVAVAVEETVPLEEVGELTVKGLTQPVVAYNVPLGAIQPALRVIEGGSPETV